MDLEKIATSALLYSISKTDTLSGFINNGDKESCWDGNIYIYENSIHSKKISSGFLLKLREKE